MFKIIIPFMLAFLFVFFTMGNAQTTFTDVTSIAKINAAGTAGVGFFDFDNDNDLDLYLNFVAAPNILFQNEGAMENFEFLEISATELPGEFNLTQNYPNPFNLTTTINYQMPVAAMVELTIYNSLGETVRTLMNQYQTAGYYSIKWDGCDQNNQSVVSGIYFYRLRVDNGFDVIRKMVVIK